MIIRCRNLPQTSITGIFIHIKYIITYKPDDRLKINQNIK